MMIKIDIAGGPIVRLFRLNVDEILTRARSTRIDAAADMLRGAHIADAQPSVSE